MSVEPNEEEQPPKLQRKHLVMSKFRIVSAWIPKETHLQLEAVAKANKVTMSRYIGAIIIDALADEAEKAKV